MSYFSIWVSERILEEGRRAPTAPKKKKAPVAHADIDRWLKSVDGLAKDLKALQDAKKKTGDKMAQIGKKYTPETKPVAPEQDKEKEKKKDVEPTRRQHPEKPRPDADKRVLSAAKRGEQPNTDREVFRKLKRKPDLKRKPTKPKPVEDEDDLE